MSLRPRKSAAEAAERPHGAATPPVQNLSEVRRRVGGPRPPRTDEELRLELEETRELLDRGLPSAAEPRLRQLVADTARRDPNLHAIARRALSNVYEVLGRYRDSLEAVKPYESSTARQGLEPETLSAVRVQLGLAYNYSGDPPKGVALIQGELREALERGGSDAQLGDIYSALSRVYRSINEYSIARDHINKALEYHRRTGDWRGLAEGYFGLAMADAHEGHYEPAIESFGQAVALVGDRTAPYLLGRIHVNLAAVYWHLRRPHEGIRALESGVEYCERTEHKSNSANAYNNLGILLTLTGDWDRAHNALRRALSLSMEMDERGIITAMIFDSLGDLAILRGDLEEAHAHLERAVATAEAIGKNWYTQQTYKTLARCYLEMGRPAEAITKAERALALAEKINDRQATCEATLLLAEAKLRAGDDAACAELLQKVSEEITDTHIDLGVAGEAQRVEGLLALERRESSVAVHRFGRWLSISEMNGDRYRAASAHLLMGRACTMGAQHERAAEHLNLAARAFRELGAKRALAQAEELLAGFEVSPQATHAEPPAQAQLLTLRLAEAVASRELLLRELAAVLHQETRADRVVIVEDGEEDQPKVVIAHGCPVHEAVALANAFQGRTDDEARARTEVEHDCRAVMLRPSNAQPATIFVSPRETPLLPGGASFEPLLRVVELGLDVCALRARARTGHDAPAQDSLAGASLMPGFIHSSPAMTALVDEVHKIRSSDVTVLVTGESGTGKELVARAIHALSSRRAKVFVPFNCTAVPKELSEGYLFGYRRGAFTGAINDSPGVIRTAAGGTLFLDEIGDLPLDVQPKLLRFLQEGEIQPLGEQRPVKVDVRIIAATNTDLEAMVADGRFREDLYYRLNVIRLRVPPLRERRSEIPTIVNYYVNHYSAKFGRRNIEITPPALDLLMVCDWPGNVRQLCNEIQRIVARAEDGSIITPEHVSPELRRVATPIPQPYQLHSYDVRQSYGAEAAESAIAQGLTLADAMAELERRMIAEALRKHNGNISRASRELGLTRRGLYLKLERYGLSATA
jgi:DNA-binding NtrC family response regulator/tetratricopeptide (TPR) repeat protein